MRYLAHYEAPTSWFTVGQVLDLQSRSRGDRLIVTPSGQRLTPSAASQNVPGLIELNEQGIYDIRPATSVGSARPEPVAVNLDPAESDLSALDPSELVASVTGHASSTAVEASGSQEMTREETERRQGLWWYLLLVGLLLLATEMVIANRLSRHEKFL
jgi:hypothetical protein